jgi:hypothetical protein
MRGGGMTVRRTQGLSARSIQGGGELELHQHGDRFGLDADGRVAVSTTKTKLQLLGATAPWRIEPNEENKPTLNTKLRILPCALDKIKPNDENKPP